MTMAPRRSPKEVEKFLAEHKDKHVCACGCGQVIYIKKHQVYQGIPKYLRGHNRKAKHG